MDKRIEKNKWNKNSLLKIAGIAFLVCLVGYFLFFVEKGSKTVISKDRLSFYRIKLDTFQEYIPRLGVVQPTETRFLDAIQAGTISKISKQSGEIVNKGDIIMTLKNSALELNVFTQESALYQRISILRDTRLRLNQNNLNQLAQLAEIDFQLDLNIPQYERLKRLKDKQMISLRQFEETEEQYKYLVKRKELFVKSFQNDSINRELQLREIKSSERRMNESIIAVKKMLDDLLIKAPISGQLSAPNFEIGESINIGERLGSVDVIGNFIMRVPVDEIFLPRVKQNQKASIEYMGMSYELNIFKIYPTVTNGVFQVDAEFIAEAPKGIVSGQNIQIRIELGDPEKTLLIRKGGFFNNTGGRWVYLVNREEGTASKHEIKIGRANPQYIEVLDGLKVGDEVIISSYDNLGEKDLLIFK